MNFFLYLDSIIFVIGSIGVFAMQKHVLIILFAFELIILAIVLNFVSSSVLIDDILGQIYALLILTVAASESALGLALIVTFYRLRGSISIDLIQLLKS